MFPPRHRPGPKRPPVELLVRCANGESLTANEMSEVLNNITYSLPGTVPQRARSRLRNYAIEAIAPQLDPDILRAERAPYRCL